MHGFAMVKNMGCHRKRNGKSGILSRHLSVLANDMGYQGLGLKVKNLKFYKSQPWPFTDTILAGFYAELEGDDAITIQEDELALGVWMNREDIPPDELKISLTGEMMEAFRTGTTKL